MLLFLISTVKLSNTSVYDYINEAMKDYLFPHKQGNKCPCKKANLSIKMRKMEPALLLPVLIILIAITSEARFFLMKMKKKQYLKIKF